MGQPRPEGIENMREAFKLQQEMLGKPEWERVRRLQRLADSISIFTKNHAELKNLLDFISTSPQGMQLFFEENRFLWEQAMQELVRLFHNYVAAGVSVVDHAKTLHGELHKNSGAFADFKAEVDSRFFNNPVAAFMRELRNHFMHVGTPTVGTRMQYTKGAPAITRDITMPKNAFKSARWTPEAKAFLAGVAPQDIDVSLVVEEYRLVVEKFFEWMYGRLVEIHKADYQIVADYQQRRLELRKAVIEPEIRKRLKAYQEGRGSIFDVLSPFLTTVDSADLAVLMKTPKAWAEEAIRRIEKLVELPTNLKKELTMAL